MKKAICMVMAIVLCLTTFAGCAESSNAEEGGVLYLSVNPEFAVHFDAENNVTKVEAMNEDGAELMNALSSYEGKKVAETVGELVEVIDEAGYFDGDAEISISIESETEVNTEELLVQAKAAIENYAKEKEKTFSVILTHGEETETFEVNESSEESSVEESSVEESSTEESSAVANTYEENGVTWTKVNESVWTSCTANIRKGPGTDFEKAGMVYYCNKYTRTAIGSNGWSKIIVNGEEVCIMSEYLTYTKPTDYEVNEDNAYHDDSIGTKPKEPKWTTTSEIMYTDRWGSDTFETYEAFYDYNIEKRCYINPNTAVEVIAISKSDSNVCKIKYNGQVLYTEYWELTSTLPAELKYCDTCGLQSESRGEELWCSKRDKDRYCGTCGKFVSANACHSCSSGPEKRAYCEDCGRKHGDGTDGTCERWMKDKTCPNCGAEVPKHTCHTCS